jgi:hypothetical protein
MRRRFDHQVVEVQQQLAAGAAADLREEVGLGELVVGESDVGRQVFDGDGPPQPVLHLGDVARQDVDRCRREGQGQEVGGVHCAHAVRLAAREGGMVRHPHGLHGVHQLGQAVQVPGVDA